jgi:hypothetical protein
MWMGETMSLNCGHQFFIPQMIYEHGEPWWNDTGRGKLLIRPPELSVRTTSTAIQQQSRRNLEVKNLALEIYFFILPRDF